MMRVNWHEAQHQLDSLIDAALHGETVFIERDSGELVQLTPVKGERKPRKAGSAEGLIWMSDDFDAPLDDFKEYMP